MPVACSTSALTGQEGSIFFKPAGTKFCLLDYTDFQAGQDIIVPTDSDYRVGDAVKFTVEGSATLDSALTAGDVYYVSAIDTINSAKIRVSATNGGAAVTLNGNGGLNNDDGGNLEADTAGAANHIKIEPADFAVICQVREFSVEISREELDVTTLPCDPCSTGGNKYASFRKTQSGYASGTGSMTVYFTDDQTSLANRLLANVMLKSQEGAQVKLYVNTECSGGSVSDADSIYIEAGISITSMSLSVTPDDATSAELSFTINDPKHILSTSISTASTGTTDTGTTDIGTTDINKKLR